MNSQHPDHRTPMLNSQYYDDSKLQRRTRFLVSGLLLCFVIGVASLGISIMILMKNQDLPDLVDYVKKAPQSQKIKADLDTAKSNITALQKEIDDLKALLKEHSTQIKSLSTAEELTLPTVMVESPSTDVDAHSSHHDSHLHHHGSLPDDPMESEILDRNLDLFFTNEGSGDGDDDDTMYDTEDYYDDVGSGDPFKCVVFPEPFCPEGHQICWTDDRCPLPFCCNADVTQ